MTQPQRAVRHPDVQATTAVILLVVGVFYGFQAVREGIGTPSDTGSGFFPLIVAIVLVIASALLLVQEWRAWRVDPALQAKSALDRAGDDEGGALEGEPRTRWARVAGVLLASLAVPLFAEVAGFVVMLSAAVAVIAKIAGMRGWMRPCALGVGFGVVAWLVFVYWLFVPLPAGVLGLG
ncbi:tripartite tricarboxylate transporter TctB family protein [Nocardioides sp. NPDC087217]|uniref:tripartite tricarboxylate transporter TctB family protein n=1 Tax=Nocardioides sp. NPDC087217 TaxID=3364335 RepID=UPI00380166FF